MSDEVQDAGPAPGARHVPPPPRPDLPPVPGAAPGEVADGVPAAPGASARPAARPAGWAALQGAREDRRSALLTVLLLALAGLPAGGVWLALAPRASYRVTDTGVDAIGGPVSPELFMSDDGVYVLILAALGLSTGVVVWLLRRHRGVVALAAMAAGMIAASLVAWQVGRLFGQGPTHADLTRVGSTVTTALDLGAVAAVAVGPFVAVFAYLVASAMNTDDDLDRSGS